MGVWQLVCKHCREPFLKYTAKSRSLSEKYVPLCDYCRMKKHRNWCNNNNKRKREELKNA